MTSKTTATTARKGRFALLTTIRRLTVAAAAVVVCLQGFAVTAASSAQAATVPPAPTQAMQPTCGKPAPGHLRCLSIVNTAPQAGARAHTADALPAGYGPADLQAAYNLPVAQGSQQTVAIVDAFDDPSAESDLAVYRSMYGLPPCTIASGCLTKLNQTGQAGNYPDTDLIGSWELEESLDMDMVSAACPNCHIELVEANSAAVSDLAAAEDTAAATGAIAISNSFGGNEFADMSTVAPDFDHPGTTIVASSGDKGFITAQFPAVLPTVLAVGGTSLTRDSSARGFTESAWSGGGSGCSVFIAKPSWQNDNRCRMRTVADVSADADPSTGVAVFDTFPDVLFPGESWYELGGTSAASPLVAGVVALSGHAVTPAFVYKNHKQLNDVQTGNNISNLENCGGNYLCVAKKGYDGPTGWGTPNGAGAF